MVTLLTIVHIVVCLFLILVVLLQAGKGGGMGIAFGGAGSQTVFGSSGAGNFLTRLTSITAALFLVTSLALAHFSSRQDSKRLQDLASQRATEKKTDEEKAAKLKAELEKNRPATAAIATDGGAVVPTTAEGASPTAPGVAAPAAGSTMPAGSTTLTLPGGRAPSPSQLPAKMELKQPELTRPDASVRAKAKPATATEPAAKKPGAPRGPEAPRAPEAKGSPGTSATDAAPGAVAPGAAAPKRPARVKPAAPKPAADAPGESTAPPAQPAAPAAPAE